MPDVSDLPDPRAVPDLPDVRALADGASAVDAFTAGLVPAAGSVTMFTTSWCGYCRQLRSQLDREGVPFTEIDIEASPSHIDLVETLNAGNRTVPTVLFPDGSAATNPSLAQVRSRMRV